MSDDLLDSALEDFEEEKKPDAPKNTGNIEEVLEEIKNEVKDEPESLEEMEKIINNIANELENNQELKDQIEQIGKDFFQEGVLKDSMEELRDKLKEFLDTHPEISASDRERYSQQLALYNQICLKITQGDETAAMELTSKLSYYGELPKELVPPMPEECTIV